MYELFELPEKATEFAKWIAVAPKGEVLRTGHGIIVAVESIPEKRVSMYNTRETNLYVVMTDFGNVMQLTIEELESAYLPRFLEKDPKARFERQQELLREAYEQYFIEE